MPSINSSNGFLTLGSGTAEDVRNFGGLIKPKTKEYEEYWALVDKANLVLSAVLKHIHGKRVDAEGWPEVSWAQKERLAFIIERDSKPLEAGDAHAFRSSPLATKSDVIDAVGMTYKYEIQPPPPVLATFNSIVACITKSLVISESLGCTSVAIPVMCTRKGGLSYEISTEATIQALTEFKRKGTTIHEVRIVLYSSELALEEEWFKQAYRRLDTA